MSIIITRGGKATQSGSGCVCGAGQIQVCVSGNQTQVRPVVLRGRGALNVGLTYKGRNWMEGEGFTAIRAAGSLF